MARIPAVVCLMWGSVLFAEDKPAGFPKKNTISELREGTWEKTALGRRRFSMRAEIVTIEKRGEKWRATFTHISSRPDPTKKKPVYTFKKEGPFPVTLKNGLMNIKRPDGIAIMTVWLDGEKLRLPTVIRLDAKTFRFDSYIVRTDPTTKKPRVQNWSQTWTCEADPSKQPKGAATITLVSPTGTKTVKANYELKSHRDGPGLMFHAANGDPKRADYFVWSPDWGIYRYRNEIPDSQFTGRYLRQKEYKPLTEHMSQLLKAKPWEKD